MLRKSRAEKVAAHQSMGEQPSFVSGTVVMAVMTTNTGSWPHTVAMYPRQEEYPISWEKQGYLVRENLKYI